MQHAKGSCRSRRARLDVFYGLHAQSAMSLDGTPFVIQFRPLGADIAQICEEVMAKVNLRTRRVGHTAAAYIVTMLDDYSVCHGALLRLLSGHTRTSRLVERRGGPAGAGGSHVRRHRSGSRSVLGRRGPGRLHRARRTPHNGNHGRRGRQSLHCRLQPRRQENQVNSSQARVMCDQNASPRPMVIVHSGRRAYCEIAP